VTGAARRARLAASRLYLCTPSRPDLPAFLDAVLGAGVDVVQLRDKAAGRDALRRAAEVVRAAAARHGALVVVNDDPALAVEVGADGVHVGQDDASPAEARAVVGPDRLVGLSTHSTAEVDAALAEPLDYLGVGPVHATPTKHGRSGIGLAPVRHAAAVCDRPFFVTGGMAPDTAAPVLAAGAHGLVVVRALTEAADPAAVTRALRQLLDRPT
jgi:thiamine-phosphate pyrophosphorylase